jgi:integration host factor subunit alpha
MTLTKSDIIDSVHNQLGYPKSQSSEAIEALLEIMKRSMENGDDVLISGFGKFCVKKKKERKGRNPATGDDLMLTPRRVVTFKCSGILKDRVNGGEK